MLRGVDTATASWDAVIATSERLMAVERGDALAASALAFVDACENAGRLGDARRGLEQVREVLADNVAIARALRDVYERTGAHAELAALLLADAAATEEPNARLPLLHRAADLFLSAGDAEAALGPLTDAHAIEPGSEQTMLLLIDSYTKLGRLQEASQMLEEAIAGHKKKRSPELARLQHRMARLSEAMHDDEARLGWLNAAFETDRTSDAIAAELAELAFVRSDHDTAMKALRVLSMMDEPVAMTKAMAFLRQAQIAHASGDARRAGHWARKAKSLDAELHEAQTFLDEIGG
jgi:tetratricopeptide (TPR) repeat protein